MSASLSFLSCSGCCGRDKGPRCAESGGADSYQNGTGDLSPIKPVRQLEEWEKYKQIQKMDEWGQPMFDEWHAPIMEWEVGQDGNYVKLTVEERHQVRKLYGMYIEDDEIPSQQQIHVTHAPPMNEPLLQQWNKQPPSQPSSPPFAAYEIQTPVPTPGATGRSLKHPPHIQPVRELEVWEKYRQIQKIDQWGIPIMEWELDHDGNYIELTMEERREVRKLYGMYTEED